MTPKVSYLATHNTSDVQEAFFFFCLSISGISVMGKREMNQGLRDSITSFKNIKITEDMIYLADQILPVRSKRQLSYQLHTDWLSLKKKKC